MKDNVESIDDCLKYPDVLTSSEIKQQYGIDGRIYYCDSNQKALKLKVYLNELSD